MKAGDRKKFEQLEELTGRHDYDGKADPLQGALPVPSYALDSTRDWLRSEAGLAIEPAEPKIEDGAVILSEEAARDPNTFRQARDTAQEQGLELRIENGEEKG